MDNIKQKIIFKFIDYINLKKSWNLDINKLLYSMNGSLTQKKRNISIETKLNQKDNLLNSWWKSKFTDKIKIYDTDNNSFFEFAMEETEEENLLLNKKQIVLGTYRLWIDYKYEIPNEYKNNENRVIDPNTAVPLYEYELTKESTIYHDLNPGIYRKYKYDPNKELLVFTNNIE